ncbi:hypothetical protein C4G88_RS03910 [Vibrio parahaemolyticus O3:K56]|uniref:hypothetical protein n=1 Tax=Vibrio parahaemolyticus TaxID=670 RepID=UPI0004486D88|nr:hypothetical protein [Vibrio parahaemolyticus]EGQ9276259.1 hypothetical protein [Vibrio vulnificus]EJG0871684.1 hypothetical protein [Vibrio parahaemolyticus O3]EJG0900343.1 hypothetical protein [Vibrio parahaemolyticus O3:K56]EII3144998.1 hypothetical protein [Vibrio parahaemolyticus]EKZ9208798.1 hypothetical protein [Vibrio parahaemolyticus]
MTVFNIDNFKRKFKLKSKILSKETNLPQTKCLDILSYSIFSVYYKELIANLDKYINQDLGKAISLPHPPVFIGDNGDYNPKISVENENCVLHTILTSINEIARCISIRSSIPIDTSIAITYKIFGLERLNHSYNTALKRNLRTYPMINCERYCLQLMYSLGNILYRNESHCYLLVKFDKSIDEKYKKFSFQLPRFIYNYIYQRTEIDGMSTYVTKEGGNVYANILQSNDKAALVTLDKNLLFYIVIGHFMYGSFNTLSDEELHTIDLTHCGTINHHQVDEHFDSLSVSKEKFLAEVESCNLDYPIY